MGEPLDAELILQSDSKPIQALRKAIPLQALFSRQEKASEGAVRDANRSEGGEAWMGGGELDEEPRHLRERKDQAIRTSDGDREDGESRMSVKERHVREGVKVHGREGWSESRPVDVLKGSS